MASSGSVTSSPQGSWVGTYGGSGYALAGWNGSSDLTAIPGGQLQLVSGSRYVWAGGTSDVRALQSPDGSTRTAATYYDANQFSVNVNLSQAYSGKLHLYAVDWDGLGRRETVTVNDGNGPQTVALSSDFSNGAWMTFPVNVTAGGTIAITVTNNAGRNAVLSGIFLGEAPTSSSSSSSSTTTTSASTTTSSTTSSSSGSVTSSPQGSWVGTYGGSGYALAGWNGSSDLTAIPGGQLQLVSGSRYVWAGGSGDVRALQSPDGSTRTAATYYDANQISVNVNLSQAYSGKLHLYAVDWDGLGRRETVTVNDGNGPQTVALSSDFSNGAWMTFPVNVTGRWDDRDHRHQ